MIFEFIKARTTVAADNTIREIEAMLDRTWDLTIERRVTEGAPWARAVGIFNKLFGRLNRIITAILRSVVSLAALTPQLILFSKETKTRAGRQAIKVKEIAGAGAGISKGIKDISANTGELTREFESIKTDVEGALEQGNRSMDGFANIKEQVALLVETIQILKESSASIGTISDVINSISDETNILSLNARIEAARSQTDGKGFKVIAEEVGHLAKQSKEATMDIRDRLDLLGDKITETVAAVSAVDKNVLSCERQILDANAALGQVCSQFTALSGNLSEINGATELQADNVKAVADNINEIERSVQQQSDDVEKIFSIAEGLNEACGRMIVDAGVFHLSGHGRSREAALEMAAEPDILSGSRDNREKALLAFLNRFPFVELAYITDAGGRQVTENIYSPALDGRDGLSHGFGNDWSEKQWFTEPAETGAVFVSEVYRSSATKEFCFTVSVPLRESGRLTGVLGIDVNFKDMLDI